MHGEKPVDVVLVRWPLPFAQKGITIIAAGYGINTQPTALLDRAWPHPPSIHEAVARIPIGNAVVDDDGAGGYWDFELSAP